MHAKMNVVYRESFGSSVSIARSPANFVEVIVREWNGDLVLEYTITVFVITDNAKDTRKEIVDGGLPEAVRRGIAVFEEEATKHPVLGETYLSTIVKRGTYIQTATR